MQEWPRGSILRLAAHRLVAGTRAVALGGIVRVIAHPVRLRVVREIVAEFRCDRIGPVLVAPGIRAHVLAGLVRLGHLRFAVDVPHFDVRIRNARLFTDMAISSPPALLRLPSASFGLVIAVLFFSCWSGFMFALALTLQSGAGLTPLQSGNAFIALGASYFLSSLTSARVVSRLGKAPTLMVGCAIQMSGLLALMLTMKLVWPHPGILNLIPATVLIGAGQALIVSSFFRIGLSEVPMEQAGAGSSMLSTVQQASFGLGAALLGSVLTQTLHLGGTYLHAIVAALTAEFCIMALLLLSAAFYRRRHERQLSVR
jgi:hypothetical protein